MNNRRNFLRNTLVVSMGISVLPIQAINKEEFYKPALNPDFRIGGLLDKGIVVKGKIFDKTGMLTRNDAFIEVWYLSPVTKKFEYEKIIKPNRFGEYKFIMDFPEKESGKLPRIHFRVATKKRSYKTELIVNDFGAYISDKHWELNKQLGDSVFPVKTDSGIHSELQFNLSI